MGTEGNFFKLVKGMYEIPTANVIFHGEKSERASPKFRNKARTSVLASVQHCIED